MARDVLDCDYKEAARSYLKERGIGDVNQNPTVEHPRRYDGGAWVEVQVWVSDARVKRYLAKERRKTK